ncbi:valine--tRNA ligase [Candidatus Wolfebacteria bacterium RIFOXYB2_FULL_49_7]|nr:MAG: Valine-tRNA ligase [Candidatus Peregrinibacteria bacterium GW2011_GWA2_33_10]KKP39790.1 MAG: valyl-tRNA synthetase, valyl-tRNA synthetase [Candidatus Peregrinibacteria bacterium GW2011_GWC2_33_13]OGM93032.1 MAG: valine--tRNA ligase [Candidatus Wolfebacteria bacterium RIFOXYB2_FULL_49_7]
MKELPKAYSSQEYEDFIYQTWETLGLFTPEVNTGKKPFSISMPPPNATGTLHLGHATMLAIEDIMIRYKRMCGYSVLWLPGTDHASIATQNKVEKIIAEEGLTRHDLGRKKFLDRVHKFVADSQSIIRNQVRKMGASCDWSRERYTLDEGLSEAVTEAFIKMYHDGVIYRGNRIVNWCPRCSSTLADDEVEYREEKAKFYYFKYGPVIIGTARPETKFLDKIIVVHPDDKRYKKYIGKEMEVEWIEGNITAKFIADNAADPEFGSGAMTITPAHSFVDFEIAKKHKLEIVQIIDEKGNLTSSAGEFAGKNAYEAREAIVEKLRKKGLVEKIDENYIHKLSVCYRCGSTIEPLVSKQWFIDVNKKVINEGKSKKSIKEKAVSVVKNGEIEIIPKRFNKTYFHWMENLRDWCISRQIWFGHRIPVYYCEKDNNGCGEIIISKDAPKKCPKCGNVKLKQDPDTLDTWFSSGLWTFSTLGWPEKTDELKHFHPTSVMETGYDILFFWVARMIIMSTYHLNEIPFKTVYLHGLVRDKQGRKMSKSLGNGIDPLDMISKYGADAVRLSLIVGATPGNDIRLYEEKIAGFRNFVNKIWNASRFALMNLNEEDLKAEIDLKNLNSADKWILTRTQNLIKKITKDMETHKYSEAGNILYDFIWLEFCDWYLEMSKVKLNPGVLIYVLKTILKLLHPFIPFVTEVLWKNTGSKNMLIIEDWPEFKKEYIFRNEEKKINIIMDIITAIRSIRAEYKVDPTRKIEAVIYSEEHLEVLHEKKEILEKMAGLKDIQIQNKGKPISKSASKVIQGVEIFLPLDALIDLEKEKERLYKEIKSEEEIISFLEKKLDNQGFVRNAPKDVVKREMEKLEISLINLKKLEQKLKGL